MKFENLNNCLNSLKDKKIILLINEKKEKCNGCLVYPSQYLTNEVINFIKILVVVNHLLQKIII